MQKEMKIGIFATLIIGLSAWGFQFLRGRNLFDNSLHLKATFGDAQHLQTGAPVHYKGTQVGRVTNIDITNGNQVTVSFDITNPKIEVPKSAIAELYTEGILQRKTAMDLLFENPCDGRDCAENGDILRGRNRSLWNSVVQTVLSGVAELDTLSKEVGRELKENYDIDLDSIKKEANQVMQKGVKEFHKEIKTNKLNIKISIDSNGVRWEKK